jgi:hypothetical protein
MKGALGGARPELTLEAVEAAKATLAAMGFATPTGADELALTRMMIACGNNVERAVEQWMDRPAPPPPKEPYPLFGQSAAAPRQDDGSAARKHPRSEPTLEPELGSMREAPNANETLMSSAAVNSTLGQALQDAVLGRVESAVTAALEKLPSQVRSLFKSLPAPL